ncbi:Uncharacterised protein [Pandoraea pnomenusa]|uniref:Uncharacterized protein n=1 Tax=Pandoraea pnomenusa TaxID=93220 RepID=A0A379KD97_9BURK|nr:hypothetical protein [Pandoraea pnomenusa]SUD65843.1 Uncharacterised protein [Pandoraea pnomenusa]
MKNRMYGVATAIFAMALAILVSVLIAWLAYLLPVKSEVLASWVQAIGSILTIIGAVIIGERQASGLQKQAEMTRQKEVRRRQNCYLAIAKVGLDAANAITPCVDGERVNQLLLVLTVTRHQLPDAIDGLRAIPIHEVGSAEAITAIAGLRQTLIWLQAEVEKVWTMPSLDALIQADRQGVSEMNCASARGLIASANRQYEAMVAALDRDI